MSKKGKLDHWGPASWEDFVASVEKKMSKKVKSKAPGPIFITQPIAVVQIQRQGHWWDTLWIHTDSKTKCESTVFAPALGNVTGVRVKYLKGKAR